MRTTAKPADPSTASAPWKQAKRKKQKARPEMSRDEAEKRTREKLSFKQPTFKPKILTLWIEALRSQKFTQHFLPQIAEVEISSGDYYNVKNGRLQGNMITKTYHNYSYDPFGVLTQLYYDGGVIAEKGHTRVDRLYRWMRTCQLGFPRKDFPEPPEMVNRWACGKSTMWGLTLTINGKRQTLVHHLCEAKQPTFKQVADALEAEFFGGVK